MPPKKRNKKGKETTITKTTRELPALNSGSAKGFENVEQDDILIPRVKLLQALSPEVEDDDLKAGTFVNSLTSEALPYPLGFVPIFFFKSRIKWFPRDDGGGIECRSADGRVPNQGALFAPFCKECEFSKWSEDGEPPECDLIFNFPSLLTDQELELPISLSFSKTSMKTGQKLLNIARFAGGDLFSRKYEMTSTKIENDKGKFYIIAVKPDGKADKKMANLAEAYFGMLAAAANIDVHDDQSDDIDDENRPPF